MYPTTQVFHELGAPHNIEVPEVHMLVLVRHGVTLRTGYVSMSFVLQFTQKHSGLPIVESTLHSQSMLWHI